MESGTTCSCAGKKLKIMEKKDVIDYLKKQYDSAFVAANNVSDEGKKRMFLNKMNIVNISLCNLMEVL